MTLRPCLTCGEPADGTYCAEHTTVSRPSRSRGYDTAWDRLSRRARKRQPFCADCGATTDLQADHSPEAWSRHDRGLPVRLSDIDVVCGPCNRARGAARGVEVRPESPGAAVQAKSGSVLNRQLLRGVEE